MPQACQGQHGQRRMRLLSLLLYIPLFGKQDFYSIIDIADRLRYAQLVLQELSRLAFQDADPRVVAVASWALAAACHAQKHGKTAVGSSGGSPGPVEGSAGGSDLSAQLRNLAGLPPEGAMKALLETVVQGHPFLLFTLLFM